MKNGIPDPFADDLFQLADPLLQREMPEVPDENLFRFLPVHQGDSGHAETGGSKDLRLQAVQVSLQFFHQLQGSLQPHQAAVILPLFL